MSIRPGGGSGGSGAYAPVSATWVTGTAYKTGELVVNGTTIYKAVDNHTAGATFAGDSAHWTQVGGGTTPTLPSLIRATSVAYAATVTPNADTTDLLNVGALTGNITLANPTGTPVDGQKLTVRMAQDATGSRTVSFGTAYAFGTDVTSSLVPTAASLKFEMLFEWNAADSKWRATGIVRGFS